MKPISNQIDDLVKTAWPDKQSKLAKEKEFMSMVKILAEIRGNDNWDDEVVLELK